MFKESRMNHSATAVEYKEKILIAVYPTEAKAQRAIERILGKDFPMDRLSVLGRVHASGDDVLGIYHLNAGDRVKAWARQGALWGGIWGLLAGAAGLFVLPGVGPILAAGPIVEAIAGALGGAAVASTALTGAAMATHLATAMHRIGIPEAQLVELHRKIEEGNYLVVLRTDTDLMQEWKALLAWGTSGEIVELPYAGIKDLL
jgi:hypothetical protein